MEPSNKYLIIDTGFFVALGNVKDQYHKKALKLLDQLPNKKWITTWPVLTEVCHLLSVVAPDKIVSLLEAFEEGAFLMFDLTQKDFSEVQKLMLKYKDLPMDLADASLVILANHLENGEILSTDCRDFHTYRWKNRKPFNNLFAQDL